MRRRATGPAMELILDIDSTPGRRVGLERAIRNAVVEGRLRPGAKLPSSRKLARDIGFSRSTVVGAYEQLIVEGYLSSKVGDGTIVAQNRHILRPPVERKGRSSERIHSDFRPGAPDGSLFPRSAWGRSTQSVLAEAKNHTFSAVDRLGVHELRMELATYLGRARGVIAAPSQVSVFNSYASALGVLGEALASGGATRVAVEDPCLPALRDTLRMAGLTTVAVPVDHEGIDVYQVERLNVDAVALAPTGQYPLGVHASGERRKRLAEWAKAQGKWVVEDSTGSEFGFGLGPNGALQNLSPERVAYLGTTSAMLSPAVNISWIVVPAELQKSVAQRKRDRAGASALEQLVLADFISRGELDRHLLAAGAVYKRRQHELLTLIESLSPWLKPVVPTTTRLHVAALVEGGGITESDVVEEASSLGIAFAGLASCWAENPARQGFLFGHGRPQKHEFRSALRHLGQFLQLKTEGVVSRDRTRVMSTAGLFE